MRQNHWDHWASQSPVTSPGPAAGAAIDALPSDLGELREAASQFVFHFQTGGDFAANGVPAERLAEIHTRYADAIFALLLSRGERSLARERSPGDRVVGCCRDATVLFVALARHKGIPARARVGFAAYLTPGWLIDHVIAEAWDAAERRWRLIDPQMSRDWTPSVNGRAVDWSYLTADQFITAPRAWQSARAGTSDPDRHGHPESDLPVLRGWPILADHVVHDLAALNKTEMLLWDGWGLLLTPGWTSSGPIPDRDAALLDEICQATADPSVPPEVVAALAARDGVRVPDTVTRVDPTGGPLAQVDVSRAGGDPAGSRTVTERPPARRGVSVSLPPCA
jgi:hypothetical protein